MDLTCVGVDDRRRRTELVLDATDQVRDRLPLATKLNQHDVRIEPSTAWILVSARTDTDEEPFRSRRLIDHHAEFVIPPGEARNGSRRSALPNVLGSSGIVPGDVDRLAGRRRPGEHDARANRGDYCRIDW